MCTLSIEGMNEKEMCIKSDLTRSDFRIKINLICTDKLSTVAVLVNFNFHRFHLISFIVLSELTMEIGESYF